MPIYEYRCESCGNEQENLLRRASAPTPLCESCGEDALKRRVSKTSFHLKGSGWYVTDYKNKPPGGGSESTTKSNSSTPSKSTGSSTAAAKSSGKSEPSTKPAPKKA